MALRSILARAGFARWRFARSVSSQVQSTDTKFADIVPVQELVPIGCFQCERAKNGRGCAPAGECGKTPRVTALQDVLLQVCKGLAQFEEIILRANLKIPVAADRFLATAMYATATNTNFDEDRIAEYIREGLYYREMLVDTYWEYAYPAESPPVGAAQWIPKTLHMDDLIKSSEHVSIGARSQTMHPDVFSLAELLTYGIRGLSCYFKHAQLLYDTNVPGKWYNEQLHTIERFIARALGYTSEPSLDPSQLLDLLEGCGKVNRLTLNFLRELHVRSYGIPDRVKVRTSPKKGAAVLVSGHDLCYLENLLKAADEQDVNIYTHGEMLPAHTYPELNKFERLVGHYGGSWQRQNEEFKDFPGPILVTSNCLVPPDESYAYKVLSMDVTGAGQIRHYSAKTHITFENIGLIAHNIGGFEEDQPETFLETGGNLYKGSPVVDDLVAGVLSRKVRHIFVVGGCDGTEEERSYYTEFAACAPEDTVILTMGCAKFRLTQDRPLHSFGFVKGTSIPRLIDIGQCNDVLMAVRLADRISEEMQLEGEARIPLTFVFSWFEQKSVAVLLTLLSSSFRNIYLGPRPPAFLSPNVMDYLTKTYNIHLVTSAMEDINNILRRPTLAGSADSDSAQTKVADFGSEPSLPT